MFKTTYFVNFQRLTGQHIASCLFSLWSHMICYCTGMQWRAEGGGRTGRRPRASKAGGHPTSEIKQVYML